MLKVLLVIKRTLGQTQKVVTKWLVRGLLVTQDDMVLDLQYSNT